MTVLGIWRPFYVVYAGSRLGMGRMALVETIASSGKGAA
jgi:hypothetical protein